MKTKESPGTDTLGSAIWDHFDTRNTDGKVLAYIKLAIVLLILRLTARLVHLMAYLAT